MRKKWLYILIALQVLFLIGIAATHYMTLKFGEQVVLKTEPIDPRDIFYGDYVTLNYDISTLSLDLLQDDGIDERERVYVILHKSGDVHEAKSVHSQKPKTEHGEIVLKGKVRWVDDYSGIVMIDYGIERFYVEEGTGKALEDERPDKISVRVSPWGNVVIKELLSNER
ncbi:GDYXXLXY domain-containing protein [Pseudalkalibacillus salsuginis]|uniref:GDYXXLXY domain-containing protein n=1 Tax=Pseudalkalibacillus salsuginis TaxID=2910972 RepID=UPI001F42B166|nr:GDYXXLXY domain-containing protein [Pseudalkalibacillus salsuginis]MCF6411167.1 GDYXXLXY domain-containing protein [Pseudalkalibacillus salsuginis]